MGFDKDIEIIFKMIEPKQEVLFKPLDGTSGGTYGLVEVDENMYEVQLISK